MTFILSVLALSDSAHEFTKNWLDYLQDKATNYGYFEDLGFLFVSDKSIPNPTLYKIKNFQLEEIQSSSTLVAEGLGSKKKRET